MAHKKILYLIICFFFANTVLPIGIKETYCSHFKLDPIRINSKVETPIVSLPEGGPTQPEVQSFTPADVTQMVNLFTGDFSYNIPLLDVGGYPINITYSQGATMEEDASCVGLGWNLSVGSINRIVRGLPDDFCGDEMKYVQYMKPNVRVGISPEMSVELFGLLGISTGATFFHDTYTGMGADLSGGLTLQTSSSNGLKGGLGCTFGLNSDDGPYYSPNITVGYGSGNNSIKGNVGYKASSFEGLENLSFGISYSKTFTYINDKKEEITGSLFSGGASGSHSFNSITALAPKRNSAMVNTGFSGKAKFGGEVMGVALQGGTSFFYTEQHIADNRKQTPAYGYLFSQKAKGGDLLDFQRDEETSVDEKVPNLPATAYTYDLFQVNGQGLSGQFRAYRNDVGILHDPFIQSQPHPNINLGMEAEVGVLVGLGTDASALISLNQSGEWIENNEIIKKCRFTDVDSLDPAYKPYYFKEVGESTLFENEIYEATADSEAIRLETSLGYLHSKFKYGINHSLVINEELINHKTPKRNTLFSYLSAEEASFAALERKINNYPLSSQTVQFPIPQEEQRVDGNVRSKHHISEITVAKDDGIRYVYGIPAYNTHKMEVSFNISGEPDILPSENQISYNGNYENYENNTNGLNHAFSSTVTPAYAYAYLLTDIVSAEYVDRTGNGPSADDNGTYTKFNYHKASNNYNWRLPYMKNAAHHDTGTNTLEDTIDGDNMASFMYGKKEIWYQQSIETKNYVATFYYSPRSDARGVIDADGGIDLTNRDQQLLRLDSISLFTRVSPDIPIQTVHFVYDYSLCHGTPTNKDNYTTSGYHVSRNLAEGGKLSLKEIYFTYQQSRKGKSIRYKFKYQHNENYDDTKNDRWGNMKVYRGEFPDLTNKDFPYVQQNSKVTADNEAAAWCLSEILTPAKAKIDIIYERDDYAYVQDKPAMQMVKFMGYGFYSPALNLSNLYRSDIHPQPTGDIIYFKLPQRNTPPNLDQRSMIDLMIQDVDELFFRVHANIGTHSEDVSGFVRVKQDGWGKDYGLAIHNLTSPRGVMTKDTIGWIKIMIPPTTLYHPFTLSTFRFTLENLPRVARGNNNPFPANNQEAIAELGDRMGDMVVMAGFTSMNDYMNAVLIAGHTRPPIVSGHIDLAKSYIRLNNPYRRKYGGGARVKRITISDNWNEMTGNSSKEYGVEYNYTLEEGGKIISSGVAAYEPETGNDENPLYQPIRIGDYDDPKYRRVVAPVGRALFPAANVGYAKVTVRSLKHEDIERTATGKTEYEFYTARDFPTLVSSTNPQVNSNLDSPGENIANALASFVYHEDQLTLSQGHAIHLNDMHGRSKSVYVFPQGDSIPITGTTYYYKTKPNNPKQLNNHIDFIAPDGSLHSGLAAMESDLVVDTRYSWDRTWTPSVNMNVNIILVYPAVVPVFTGFGWIRYSGTLVHVVSTTKVIHQTGILDSVVAFDNGAKIITKNIAYDSETGIPILTETGNEFKDKYYTLKVPSHWVEPGMGRADFNTGNEYHVRSYSNGFATIDAGTIPINQLFFKGDEVVRKDRNHQITGGDRLWVDSISMTGNRIRLIDRNGNFMVPVEPLALSNTYLKIIRSGKRNMQSIPVGEITMQENPINITTRRLTNNWRRVLAASATKYTDRWQTYNIQRVRIPSDPCNCQPSENGSTVIQRILNHILQVGSFSFTSLLIPNDVVSPKERARYFGSDDPLRPSSHVSGNCIFISLNETCTLELCTQNGEMIPGNSNSNSANNPLTHVTSSGQLIKISELLSGPACNENYQFTTSILFKQKGTDQQNPLLNNEPIIMMGRSTCIPLNTCIYNDITYTNSSCDLVPGINVNPYVEGILGNYRPYANYVYNKGERSSSSETITIPLKESGFFDENFRPFWSCDAFTNEAPTLWTAQTVVNKIDPNGRTLETKNAIGVYSSDLYGFNKNLVVASAQNASYSQIVSESFEDFNYPIGIAIGGCAFSKHLQIIPMAIDATISHSGKNSLRLAPNTVQRVDVSLLLVEPRTVSGAYGLRLSDLAGHFKPTPGEYYVSVWIQLDGNQYSDLIYNTYGSAGLSMNGTQLLNRTHIIDGWQQLWGTVTISGGQNNFAIELRAGTEITRFDDLRIQPANSSMQTYVYRPDNLRLCAQLDENNFATFYEYDEEGALTRTKKETEEGVMTIQEVRFANSKTP